MDKETAMRRMMIGLGIVAVLGLFLTAGRAEEKLELDKVPKAVMDAVKAKFPGAKITGASKEKDDKGKELFELAFTFKPSNAKKDYKYEVELYPDGSFIAIDKQIEFAELPKAVAKTMEEKYPKATYKVIEE